MSEFKLVPAQMHLDRETIGAINFHCGDGADGQFGEYSHGLLWIGTVTDDDGKEVYGLHLATAEYPEEGSTTLVEFAAPAPPACGDAEVKRFHLDATDGQLAEMVESQEGYYCEFEHVTRLTAERDALQLLLNDRDEQLHTLEQSRRAHFENAQAAERRVDELEQDKARLDALEANCWDVRYDSSSNGDAGDSSISIEVVGRWMDKPHERVIGEDYSENLRAAIDQAMAAPAYPPARPEYPELDAALNTPL